MSSTGNHYNGMASIDKARGYMRLAIDSARKGFRRGQGGPFGACIVKDGRVLAVAHNSVLRDKAATRHAEIRAIEEASRRLKTHELDGCELFSTTEPCVMCFAAINWARIPRVTFGTTVSDAKKLGFNELTISNSALKRLGKSAIRLRAGVLRDECRGLFEEWRRFPGRQTY